jgi:hypothetical protein
MEDKKMEKEILKIAKYYAKRYKLTKDELDELVGEINLALIIAERKHKHLSSKLRKIIIVRTIYSYLKKIKRDRNFKSRYLGKEVIKNRGANLEEEDILLEDNFKEE